MLAGVADDLGGSVEAHRLGVQERRAEHVRVVALHPGRGVGDLGEAGRVAFGKAVGAEALDLLDQLLRELGIDAVPGHAGHQLFFELADALGVFEGRHRLAQLVRARRREARALDRDLHRLFLEQRHAVASSPAPP
jgi:hypothetical protein